MTIIEGTEGITIVDPLISAETSKVALDLYCANRGDKPVKAVIYTHSHVDHYGGVRGVVSEEDVASGRSKIYAPDGFLEAAVAENVMAGNAMSRRASYMYGNLLPPDPKGQVGAGLGTTTSAGTVTLIPPTDIITETGQKEVIDGLTYEFLMAPGSEAPSEMMWFIEEKEAMEAAEDATHTLHNTYSLARRQDPRAAALVEVPERSADHVGRQDRGGLRPAPLADLGQRRGGGAAREAARPLPLHQ